MDERRKKLLFIFLFSIAVIGIGALLYLLFFRAITPTEQPGVVTPGGRNALPRAASGTPGMIGNPGGSLRPSDTIVGSVDLGEIPVLPNNTLIPDQAKSSIIAQNVRLPVALNRAGGNAVRYYDATDGRFYSILDDGTKAPLSDTVFPNVDKITWGNQSEKALIGFPDGNQVIYDFQNERQTTIPRFWQDVQFSPEDNEIAAKSLGSSPTNRFLILADSDGSDPRPIEELGNNQDKVMVSWSPNNQSVAFSRTGDALGADREQILLVGKNHENFKGLVVEGRGFTPNWSPDGSQLVYSVWSGSEGYRPALWISGASGDNVNANRRRLNLSTWADKCTWANGTTVLCGVPQELPTGAGLQRALFDVGPDVLYKIDLANGQVSPLTDIGSALHVKSVKVSGDGQYAFVVDGKTEQLVKIRL